MEYELSITTFIDILGFRNRVTHEPVDRILKTLNTVRTVATPDRFHHLIDDLEPKVFFFSDSILRVISIESETNKTARDGIFFHELLSLAYLQIQLLTEGVLVRGAVTVGKVFSDLASNVVFGPAMNEAYLLETKFAQHPRIIISPVALTEFKKLTLLRQKGTPLEAQLRELRGLLSEDSDGFWFVDYLKVAQDDQPEEYLAFLQTHRDLISDVSLDEECPTRVGSKYLWLSKYHDNHTESIDEKALQRLLAEWDEVGCLDDLRTRFKTLRTRIKLI